MWEIFEGPWETRIKLEIGLLIGAVILTAVGSAFRKYLDKRAFGSPGAFLRVERLKMLCARVALLIITIAGLWFAGRCHRRQFAHHLSPRISWRGYWRAICSA